MSSIPLTISGDLAQVQFKTFDLAEYDHFLTLKRTLPTPEMDLSYDWERDIYTVQFPARYAAQFGHYEQRAFEPLVMAPDMWDYQQHFVKWALKRKRAAFFWDCGLGKTRAFLEFARQAMAATGKKALIVCACLIVCEIKFPAIDTGFTAMVCLSCALRQEKQLIEWLKGQDYAVRHRREQGLPAIAETIQMEGCGHGTESGNSLCGLKGNCAELSGPDDLQRIHQSGHLAIVNYEKFIPGQIAELRALGALILDESSILKTGGGQAKAAAYEEQAALQEEAYLEALGEIA